MVYQKGVEWFTNIISTSGKFFCENLNKHSLKEVINYTFLYSWGVTVLEINLFVFFYLYTYTAVWWVTWLKLVQKNAVMAMLVILQAALVSLGELL